MGSGPSETQLRTEDFRRLLDVARALAHRLDLQDLLGQIVDAARDLLDAERGSVFLHDAATGDLTTTVATGTGEIRVPRGREFAARVENRLGQPLVLHWHGVLAPERMDGHPRDQVAAGQTYQVQFPVHQQPSTCWYHAHTDQLTAEQACQFDRVSLLTI